MKKAVMMVLIVFWLAGCAGAAQPAYTPKGSILTATPPATSIPQTSRQDVAVIVVEKTGGIAGVHMKWMIFADGRIIPSDAAHREPDAKLVENLLVRLQKLGFYDLQTDYSSASKCNDCFIYTITVSNAGITKSVTGVDGDAGTPLAFMQALDAVLSFINPS